ncbi:MAG TPA: hypothetical protein VLC09_19275, partial [Polyangiaceae bacterium]|nr:hypothetical protein [Polyangiaceae bacterium]
MPLRLLFLTCLVLCGLEAGARAAVEELDVAPAEELAALEERSLDAVQVETVGSLWPERVELRSVRPGDKASGAVIRRALEELSESGRFAELDAELQDSGGRLTLVVWVRPRRLLARAVVEGSPLTGDEVLRAWSLSPEDELTDRVIEEARERVRALHEQAGYLSSKV